MAGNSPLFNTPSDIIFDNSPSNLIKSFDTPSDIKLDNSPSDSSSNLFQSNNAPSDIISDNSTSNLFQSYNAPSIPPSMTQSMLQSFVPPSMTQSILQSFEPPSMSQSVQPSLSQSAPSSTPRSVPMSLVPPSLPINQNNTCDCLPKNIPPAVILNCESTNISYDSGNLNQCACPSTTRVFKLTANNEIKFNKSRSGNGTYNRITNMCSLNNTKVMITDKNGQNETICIDDVYSNITGGSVKKYWCSNK